MKKELDALKRIRQETCPATILPDFDKEECCKIIENALKEKEHQDNVLKILKDTISLGYIPPKISIDNDKMDFVGSVNLRISETLNKEKTDLIRNWILRTCFPDELKALEIIKNKKVDIWLIQNKRNVEEYNSMVDSSRWITKEEYELLKRVLK